EQALADLGEAAAPALRQALEGNPSFEARQRIQQLLKQIDPARTPERLRVLRAMEILEYVGTPEAKRLLSALAKGANYARQTEEAREALRRLDAGSGPSAQK